LHANGRIVLTYDTCNVYDIYCNIKFSLLTCNEAVVSTSSVGPDNGQRHAVDARLYIYLPTLSADAL